MSKIDYQALQMAAERAIPAMERLLILPVDDDLLSEQELKDYGVDIDAINTFRLLAGPEDMLALLDELEAADKELSTCKSIMEKIKSTSCHVDTSKGAFIPNSLDAWGRPVPQYLPYDFSGTPGASATQYCNGWNDAGGYWLNHVKYLQECITAAGIITKVGE